MIMTLVDRLPSRVLPSRGPRLGRCTIQFQLFDQCGAGAEFDEALEDVRISLA